MRLDFTRLEWTIKMVLSLRHAFYSFVCGFALFLSGTGLAKEMNVMDPTKPVYSQSGTLKGVQSGQDQVELNLDIPPLIQLLYSKSRKIALFGENFVREGDITPFGRIILIQKDRVLLEQSDNQVTEIFMFDSELAPSP